MAKRSNKQIEKDFARIKKYVTENSNTITSINEVAIGVGLSENQVRTTLEKNPKVYSIIKQWINKNREAKKKLEEKAIKALKEAEKAELEAKRKAKKAELEAKRKAKNAELEAKRKAPKAKLSQPTNAIKGTATIAQPEYYVIDASICGIDNLYDVLNDILSKGAKIVLTNITSSELNDMQKYKDSDGKAARRILDIAAQSPEDYINIHIDGTVGINDDCIIKYCADNKGNVVLLTSDKWMTLKARSFGVETHFYPRPEKPKHKGARIITLVPTRKVGKKLFISNFNTPIMSITVISKGKKFNQGTYELKIGDEVYLATKKPRYLTFAHYRMISLGVENNCTLVYSKRIHSKNEFKKLPEDDYKLFMQEFSRKVNF